jgi:hypothetical protein
MGGGLPMHTAMLYYGWLISNEGFNLIDLNERCSLQFPKLDLDDVKYMIVAHAVCIFVISANKLLSF